MKRSKFFILALALAILGITGSVGAVYRTTRSRATAPRQPQQDYDAAPAAPAASPYAGQPTPGADDPYGGREPAVSARTAADANAVLATVRKFKGLEDDLKSVETKSSSEVRDWLSQNTDNKLSLARAVDNQIVAELELIKKIAVQEGANKTAAAIDGLMLHRRIRYEKIAQRMRDTQRESRTTRTTRTRGRTDTRTRTQRGATEYNGGLYQQTPQQPLPQEDPRRTRRR